MQTLLHEESVTFKSSGQGLQGREKKSTQLFTSHKAVDSRLKSIEDNPSTRKNLFQGIPRRVTLSPQIYFKVRLTGVTLPSTNSL